MKRINRIPGKLLTYFVIDHIMFHRVVFFVSALTCAATSDSEPGNEKSLLAMVLHCSQRWSASQETLCPEACRLWPEYCYYAVAAEYGVPGTCKFPPYPRVGSYIIENIAGVDGAALADFTLFYTCPPDYTLLGQHPRCRGGMWTAAFPSCQSESKCQLKEHPSVTYNCIDYASRKCPEWVGSGERVQPECRANYVQDQLGLMYCIDGSWNFVATCRRECGRMSNDQSYAPAALPWYAAVYRKKDTPYRQICGGSLVSANVVISAAHCFWDDVSGKAAPASGFAVAVGSTHRAWSSSMQGGSHQTSDVSDVKLPPRFRGQLSSFQDDISVVILATPVYFGPSVQPVCLDWSTLADEKQLRNGSVGKIAGWNLTPVLRVIELSYVEVERCYSELPQTSYRYITSDKSCAVSKNGKMCAGDSGGGLAFPAVERGAPRWYLRGVASVAPKASDSCHSYVAFTKVLRHSTFIVNQLQVAGDVSPREYSTDATLL